MPGNYYTDQEAIAAGLYDTPGSAAANALAASNKKLMGNGPSDLFTAAGQDYSYDNSSVLTSAQGFLGQKQNPASDTKQGGFGIIDKINEWTKKLDSVDPTSKTYDPTSSFGTIIPRIAIVVLGFIFVAVGLALFGVNTGPGQELVRKARDAIPP